MFSSSEDEAEATPATPFNAITAAAKAVRARAARQRKQSDAEVDVEAILEATPDRQPQNVPERKSRYIASLVASTKARQEEQQRVTERKLVEEAARTGEERYVTPAYRRVLEERQRKETGGKIGFKDTEEGLGGKLEAEDDGEEDEGLHVGNLPVRNNALGREDKGSEVNEEDRGRKESNIREVVREKKKRGMRRNDEKAIEAYRRRYFERRAQKLAENGSAGKR